MLTYTPGAWVGHPHTDHPAFSLARPTWHPVWSPSKLQHIWVLEQTVLKITAYVYMKCCNHVHSPPVLIPLLSTHHFSCRSPPLFFSYLGVSVLVSVGLSICLSVCPWVGRQSCHCSSLKLSCHIKKVAFRSTFPCLALKVLCTSWEICALDDQQLAIRVVCLGEKKIPRACFIWGGPFPG